MLAGDADRERAGDVLKAGYAEGRLTKGEFEERLARAAAARTVEELRALTADLPQGPAPLPPAPPVPYGPPYPAWPSPPPPSPPRRVNPASTAALVCGLLAPVTCGVSGLPAVLLGHWARREIRTSGEQGDGAAVAGLALGWLALGMLALVLILG